MPWYDERFKGYRKNKVRLGAGLASCWVAAAPLGAAKPPLLLAPRQCVALHSAFNQPASPSRPQVVHLMHMFRLGMEFASTPHGYVVHSPHPVANSWNTTQSTGFWYKVRGRGRAGRDWRRAECRGGCTCAWAWRLPV